MRRLILSFFSLSIVIHLSAQEVLKPLSSAEFKRMVSTSPDNKGYKNCVRWNLMDMMRRQQLSVEYNRLFLKYLVAEVGFLYQYKDNTSLPPTFGLSSKNNTGWQIGGYYGFFNPKLANAQGLLGFRYRKFASTTGYATIERTSWSESKIVELPMEVSELVFEAFARMRLFHRGTLDIGTELGRPKYKVDYSHIPQGFSAGGVNRQSIARFTIKLGYLL